MAVICPTVTAFEPHEYREQMERLEPFAKRIHIDLMDGRFAPHTSPSLDQIWWPEQVMADLHLMYQRPTDHLDQIIKLKPNLAVIHFETDDDKVGFARTLKENSIKAGLALLQDTEVEEVASTLLFFDHVMVYSGNLGEHGGVADLSLLDKVKQLRQSYPNIEISWDGGINDQNVKQLLEAGVDVLNVGGYIAKSEDPAKAFNLLQTLI